MHLRLLTQHCVVPHELLKLTLALEVQLFN